MIDYDFINEISVGCRYYRNWTDTYRDEDYNLKTKENNYDYAYCS